MLPRIYSDFNNKDELHRVRLNLARSKTDMENSEEKIASGAHVLLYVEDEFEVEAVLDFDAKHNLWVASPIYSTIMYRNSPGRGSIYRCGESVQTNGTRSMNPFGFKIIGGLREKYRFVCTVFLVNAMALMFLSLYVSKLLLIPFLISPFLCGFYAYTLRCPVCNKPVLLNPINHLGFDIWAYTPTIPPNCTKCGEPLN